MGSLFYFLYQAEGVVPLTKKASDYIPGLGSEFKIHPEDIDLDRLSKKLPSGAVGPMGPQGPQGIQGPKGDKGDGVTQLKSFGAKGDTVADDSGPLTSSMASTSTDTIVIPKGVYLIAKNTTIPATKKLVFDSGAILSIAKGVTLTINGTWDANPNDQIFDLSLGGTLAGNPKVDFVYPEWFGAKGDGTTDDTKSFQYAMSLCDKKRVMKLRVKNYLIRETIENNARGIIGTNSYVDSGNGGTLLTFDPIDTQTDLLPCLRISSAGAGSVFEKFRIAGKVAYNSRYLSRWIDKAKFEANTYDMFAVGVAAIEIAGSATPVLRDISTTQVKVGLFLTSTKGHISIYDCAWNGLIGVYCRANSGDYFFQGGTISSAFCNVLLGITLEAGHYGGFPARMTRVHMGFSPYGFYQVKDAPNYDSIPSCLGVYGSFESVRFEMIGEACVKLLPKSISSGYWSGLGLTWSPIDYTDAPGRWQFSLPDDLMPQDQKQKYAFVFGQIDTNNKLIIDKWDAGGAAKSKAPGALGVAYFDFISSDEIMLDGFDPTQIFYRRKRVSTSLTMNTLQAVEDSIHANAHNPIRHGQLIKNPEVPANWTWTGGGTMSVITDLSQLPVQPSSEMKAFLGNNIKVLKLTPDGASQFASIKPPAGFVADTSREICFEYFILSHTKSSVASRLAYGSPTQFLYYDTFSLEPLTWRRVRSRGIKSPTSSLLSVDIGANTDTTNPTYRAGVMVNYDHNASYSPYNHAHTTLPLETTDGIILTDTVTGARFKVVISNGALTILPV